MTTTRHILLMGLCVASAGLVLASPSQDRRGEPEVRRAMASIRRQHKVCQWCGKPSRLLDRLDVVHAIPISVDGSQAANTNLMRVMHHSCHMILQHNGDFSGRRYVQNFLEWIDSAKVVTP